MLEKIFQNIGTKELKGLCKTSHDMQKAITAMCCSKVGFNALMPTDLKKFRDKGLFIPNNYEHERKVLAHIKNFGTLVKRATCLLPTDVRLCIISDIISKHVNSGNIGFKYLYDDGKIKDMATAIKAKFFFQCAGRFIHSFIAGWDELECAYVYCKIWNTSGLGNHWTDFLNGKNGADKYLEYFMRNFWQYIFLEYCHSVTDKAYWLHLVLNHPIGELTQKGHNPATLVSAQKSGHVSRILFLIYGPLVGNQSDPIVGWLDITDTFFDEDGMVALSEALNLLSKHLPTEYIYGEQKSLALIESLTNTPVDWLPENVASLLYHCNQPLVSLFVSNLLAQNRIEAVSSFIVFYSIVCFKNVQDLSCVFLLLETIIECRAITSEVKLKLLISIPSSFHDTINDAAQLIDEELPEQEELSDILSAMHCFMGTLLLRLFSPPEVTANAQKHGLNVALEE